MTRDRASRGSGPAPIVQRPDVQDARSPVRTSYPTTPEAASRVGRSTPAARWPAWTDRYRVGIGPEGGDA